MLGARLQGFVERGRGRRAVRRGGRDLYKREQWIHKRFRVFCARELREAESLRCTL